VIARCLVPVRALLAVLCLLWLPGCEKAARNMYEQPKYRPLVASTLWQDGASARPLEPGVVARSAGALSAASSGRMAELAPPQWTAGDAPRDAGEPGKDGALQPLPTQVSMEFLRRGRERYDIYCAPCHSVSGDGDGMVVRRGFPAPASFHIAAMRSATDARLFDAITRGYGVMYPFADRIDPQDRWAIVAYVRALQRSQHASIEDVPQDQRRELSAGAP